MILSLLEPTGLLAAEPCALFIFAAGFEERARAVPARLRGGAHALVVRYRDESERAEEPERALRAQLMEAGWRRVTWVDYEVRSPSQFTSALRTSPEVPTELPSGEVWIDISGMTHFAAAASLAWARKAFPERMVRVLYTEAQQYFPSHEEYERFNRRKNPTLPEALSIDMDSVVLTDEFTGFSLRDQSSVLIMFPGYEPHRAFGLVGEYNPQKIVCVYARPDQTTLAWRLELSRRLHRDLRGPRPYAEEEASTTDVGGVTAMLVDYYRHLYDDHNLILAPACSKLHGLAAFLVWELFRDIQLVFTKPVRYLAERSCIGVGRSFTIELPPPPRILGISLDYAPAVANDTPLE